MVPSPQPLPLHDARSGFSDQRFKPEVKALISIRGIAELILLWEMVPRPQLFTLHDARSGVSGQRFKPEVKR